MGSGKGRTRRTQSSIYTDAPPSADFQIAKWEEFVEGLGVQNVKIRQYYLEGATRKLTFEDCGKLITELFVDAVTSGALTIPSSRKAEEFEFCVVSELNSQKQMEVRLVGSTRSGSLDAVCEVIYFNSEGFLGVRTMKEMASPLNKIAFSISHLLARNHRLFQ
jgi:hypothetical protein